MKKEGKTINIKIPSLNTLSGMSIPLSIVVSGIAISLTLLSVGNSIKSTLQNYALTNTNQAAANTNQQAAAQPSASVTMDEVKTIFSSNKYIKFGDENRKNLFVEFTDPSCPYCHAAAGKNPELNQQMGSQFTLASNGGSYVSPVEEMRKQVQDGKASLAVIYTTGHGNGKLGMQALYCAYDKNKFWEVHDLLMTNKGYSLLNDTVKNDVANAGVLADFLTSAIDKNYLVECLQSKKYESRVSDDDQFAASKGINGTPGFYVNDSVVEGAVGYSSISAKLK